MWAVFSFPVIVTLSSLLHNCNLRKGSVVFNTEVLKLLFGTVILTAYKVCPAGLESETFKWSVDKSYGL